MIDVDDGLLLCLPVQVLKPEEQLPVALVPLVWLLASGLVYRSLY
jgi:hypothetical protein